MSTNHKVAQDWARQSKADGHTSNGNLSFSGRTLYSYSTPIAQLVQAPGGEVALLTTESYSITTEGKHKNAARAALRSIGYKPFTVPFLLLDGSLTGRSQANAIARRNNSSATEQHKANLDSYAARIEAEQARLARARVYKSTDHLDRLIAERDAYARTFGC